MGRSVSYSVDVFAPFLPKDCGSTWREALTPHGLTVEVYPGFNAATWQGGCVPFRVVAVEGAFPAAHRYGQVPVVAGFEVAFLPVDADELNDLLSEAPAELRDRLRATTIAAHFRTAMGRTVADLRLQCFGAATLAEMTGGVLLDPQEGRYYSGRDALGYAARESEAFESNPVSPRDWELVAFPGWDALE